MKWAHLVQEAIIFFVHPRPLNSIPAKEPKRRVLKQLDDWFYSPLQKQLLASNHFSRFYPCDVNGMKRGARKRCLLSRDRHESGHSAEGVNPLMSTSNRFQMDLVKRVSGSGSSICDRRSVSSKSSLIVKFAWSVIVHGVTLAIYSKHNFQWESKDSKKKYQPILPTAFLQFLKTFSPSLMIFPR